MRVSVASPRHTGILAHTTEGAALCFLAFCQEGFHRIGPYQHPDVTLDCVAMGRSLPAWESGDYAPIRAVLAHSVERLAKVGAEFFACPCNTAHLALEVAGADLALPGVHIADVVANRAAKDGYSSVGVLGTKLTMDGPVYRRALEARGLRCMVPPLADREMIDEIIYGELVNGVLNDASRIECVRVVENLRRQGCEAVALACTEIPLLVNSRMVSLPLLDSTKLLAQAAFDVATGLLSFPTWRGGPADAGSNAR